MELDRCYFWSSYNRAVIGFVLRGSHAVVIGGLIGPGAERESLLTQFLDHCRVNRWTACFGIIPERDLHLFDRHGFESTKIGEDALIDLRECTWQGKPYEWVRRQSNYCRRQGLICQEIIHMPGASDAVGMASESRDSATASQARNRISELLTISNLFLDHTPHGRTMRYFVGQFNPECLHRRRTFAAVAGGGAGRAEGFVVCTPYRDGKAWGIEMYRARPDAIRGTIPFLIHATMQALKCEALRRSRSA